MIMKKVASKIILICPIIFYLVLLITKTTDIKIDFSENLAKHKEIYSKINNYNSVDIFFTDLSKVIKQEINKSNSMCFVADSTIIGLKEIANKYYIKTMIKLANNEIVYAYLSCTKNIYQKAMLEKNHNSLLKFKIDFFEQFNSWNYIEDFDNIIQYEWLLKKYFIKGECIDIITTNLS